jgi:hypothetical protein
VTIEIGPLSRPARATDRAWRVYRKGVVIEPGLALNRAGAIYWRLADGDTTLVAIAGAIAAVLGGAEREQVLDDIVALTHELYEQSLVSLVG